MNFLQKLIYTPNPKMAVSMEGRKALQSQVGPVLARLFNVTSGGFSLFRSGVQFREAARSGYNVQVWVNRCIRARADAVASIPWKVSQRKKSGELKQLLSHPILDLINRPNPDMDKTQFFNTWMLYLDLGGNCFWEKVFVKDLKGNGNKVPKWLCPIRPDWLVPAPDSTGTVTQYVWSSNSATPKQPPIERAAIVHFQYVDPLNPYYGLSPITAAARAIETEDAAGVWNKSILDNYAIPSGVLKVPQAALADEDKKNLQEDIEQEFTGENRHRPMVLWGGLEWEQTALSHAEMEFGEQRKTNKFEICAVLGVPPNMIGANEDPTYSNYETSRLSFWEDTIIPLLDWIATKFNNEIAPYFGDDLVVSYDISNVPAFRAAFSQKVDTGAKLIAMGVPLNAINARLGLGFEEFEWGDVAWMNQSLVPVSNAEAPTAPVDSSQSEPVNPLNEDDTQDTEDPPEAENEGDTEKPPSENEAAKKRARRRILY